MRELVLAIVHPRLHKLVLLLRLRAAVQAASAPAPLLPHLQFACYTKQAKSVGRRCR
jgi:hypothetical protein